MKILLVNPSFAYTYGKMKPLIPSYPPIGLAYLASALNNHETSILDMSIDKMNEKKFRKYVKKGNFDIVMFTATTPTIKSVGKLCKIVKECNKDIITVVGGSHPTAIPERTLKEFGPIDIVVIGEGEKTVSELVTCLSKKEKIDKVRGICIRKNKKIVKTTPRPFIENLDSISFPRYDLLPLDSYTYWIQHGKKFAPILTSRGCPYKCTFCTRGCFGNYYRKRSVRNVIDEIEWLRELGVNEIHIIDDNFTLIKKHAITILDEIIKNFPDLHLALINGVRADRITKEILIKMKKANVYYIGFGIESGDQKVLDSVKKGLSLTQAKKAVQLSKDVGIEIIVCFFILGLPSDSRKSILKTIELAKKLNPDFVKFSTFVPYPGTEIYENLNSEGKILTEDWDKYCTYGPLVFEHPNFSALEFEHWQKKAYTNFFLLNSDSIFKHFIRGMIKPRLYRNIFKILPKFLNFALF